MTAYFKHSAPSYQSWFPILQSDQVEVLVPKERVNYVRPGRPPKYIDGERFHQIDVPALNPAQKQRLVKSLAEKWKLQTWLIEDWLADSRNGIPLIASDVVAVAMGLFS